ncbi:MAG: hypothetical protein H0U57_12560 [Tatlockia sp.]|nr:hypothetical protein [Tatlockia sp.]
MYYRLENLGQMSAMVIAQTIAAIPLTVTSLDLTNNSLGSKTGAELAQVFTAIPASVTSLNLCFNNLGSKPAAELAQAFAAIPATVTSLDLRYNNLGSINAAELAQVFAAIPASVTSLNLRSNKLDRKTAAELVQIFAAIPASVTSLNLRSNLLGSKKAAELVQIFAKIPASVTSLNLGGNNLDSKTAAELVQIFAAIPASVTSFNLRNNDLGHKTVAELVQIFAALPASVTTLNLKRNDLGHKTAAELAQVFAALPASVTTLNLKGNFLNLNDEQLDEIIKALPEGVESVILDDKTIYIDKFLAEQLKTQVRSLCSQKVAAQLRFDTIKLDVEIDETYLNRLVQLLERQNDPLANFACGLLLEGQIETAADIIDNCSAFDEYMEKRTQDAISFYTKASEDRTIKPIAEFLLWEMKMTSHTPSIQKRLSQYDVTPQSTCEAFNQTSKVRTEVSPLLFAHSSLFKPSPESECNDEVKSNKTLGL